MIVYSCMLTFRILIFNEYLGHKLRANELIGLVMNFEKTLPSNC